MSNNGNPTPSVQIEDGIEEFGRKAFGSEQCRQRFLVRTRSLVSALEVAGRDIEPDLFKTLRAIEWYIEQERDSAEEIGQELASQRARLVEALVQRNTGLVFAMIKRRQIDDVDHDDLISHGLWTLFQSVLRFDPWRGFRFSSYACTAIGNGFRLLARKKHLNQSRMALLGAIQGRTSDIHERESNGDREIIIERLQKTMAENHAELTGIERYVIDRRLLGSDRRPATLEAIGNSLALSKERVRQIQLMGLAKLRVFVAGSAAM